MQCSIEYSSDGLTLLSQGTLAYCLYVQEHVYKISDDGRRLVELERKMEEILRRLKILIAEKDRISKSYSKNLNVKQRRVYKEAIAKGRHCAYLEAVSHYRDPSQQRPCMTSSEYNHYTRYLD